MMTKRRWQQWLLGIVLGIGMSQLSAAAERLIVYAAASMTNALEIIAADYQKKQGVEIVASFASSSTLARQIEQGAPAELFISADQQWMNYLMEKSLIEPASRITLLGNQLVLIAPKLSLQASVMLDKSTDWKTLLKGGKLAVGDPAHVPVGFYAKEALEHLGIWQSLSTEIARTSNVRAALALVEREEASLGIVYASDVVASDKVKIVAVFSGKTHQPVEYPMAIVAGKNSQVVTAFYHYLQGPEAAAVFKRSGFNPKL